MGGWRLTIRHGARVERASFDSLDGALAALREQVEAVRDEGPLDQVSMLRTYSPGDRVAARLELSGGGWLRRREAGVDVMGDGALVPYAGGVRRRALQVRADGDPIEAVQRELSG